MASNRQVAANQQNAKKSTGPKSEAGKKRSSRNALKHGLAGNGNLLTERDEAVLRDREESWERCYTLRNDQERFLFKQMVLSGVRIESALLSDGAEVQVGKFRLTFYASRLDLASTSR